MDEGCDGDFVGWTRCDGVWSGGVDQSASTLTCMALRITIFSVNSFFMSSSILSSCSRRWI